MPNLAYNQVLQIQADGLDFGVCTDLEPDLGFQAEIKPQIPRRPTTRKQKTNPQNRQNIFRDNLWFRSFFDMQIFVNLP